MSSWENIKVSDERKKQIMALFREETGRVGGPFSIAEIIDIHKQEKKKSDIKLIGLSRSGPPRG
jgi:hypothetical protein